MTSFIEIDKREVNSHHDYIVSKSIDCVKSKRDLWRQLSHNPIRSCNRSSFAGDQGTGH